MSITFLTKILNHALRLAPEELQLELDREGFVSLDDLLYSLNHYTPHTVSEQDLLDVINKSPVLELSKGKVRARCGHDPHVLSYDEVEPFDKVCYIPLSKMNTRLLKVGDVIGQDQYIECFFDEDKAEGHSKKKRFDTTLIKNKEDWEFCTKFYTFSGRFFVRYICKM